MNNNKVIRLIYLSLLCCFINIIANGDAANECKVPFCNVTSKYNTVYGDLALQYNTIGINNLAIGGAALQYNTIGSGNTANGVIALRLNNTGNDNTASGIAALFYNTTGSRNTASGSAALHHNSIGNYNMANGVGALRFNTTGNYNTASGAVALMSNINGSANIALGYEAGINLNSGDYNIYIGNPGYPYESGVIRIGDYNHGACFIAGINYSPVSSGQQVIIDSNGQLGAIKSSKRYKKDIRNINLNSKDIKDLRPVEFSYKKDKERNKQYGLIAEEVEKTFPELVIYNKDNKPESVKYDLLPALLLDELKRQDERIKEQNNKHKNAYKTMLNKIEDLNIEILKLKHKNS